MQGKALTFASDIYSAGVLLYRLLTGRPPYRFTDYSPAAIADRISHTEPDPSGLDAPLDAILSTALDKNPEKRYASAVEMDADLARYLEGQPVRARGRRKIPQMAVIAMLAAAIVLCASAAWAFFHRSDTTRPASIAVLPFANPGSDARSRYLNSGLTEELTESLARMKTLRVIASASVAQFGGKKIDVREVGRLLGVANVLEGSMDRDGDRVKIIARLERVEDASVLWSNTYERPASDLLDVQSDLLQRIAKTLRVAPNPMPKHVPNAEAHDAVMKGRYEMQQMTTGFLNQAGVDFQHAIDLDPQYAFAYLARGIQIFNQGVARGSTYQTEEERNSSKQLLQKALSLDPNLPAAHGMLAMMAMQYDWDWDRAERELKLGAALGPNANVEQGYASLLLFRGRFAEADQHIQRLQEIDPFETAVMANISLMRLLEGRIAEARATAQKISAAYPNVLAAKMIISGCDILDGRTDVALEEIREWKKSFPPAQMYEAMAQAHAGNREEALRLIRPFEEKYPESGRRHAVVRVGLWATGR